MPVPKLHTKILFVGGGIDFQTPFSLQSLLVFAPSKSLNVLHYAISFIK